jgi:methylmalonyl-CoA mutase
VSSEEQREKLFGEFPPVTTSQWEDKIREDLKGADYNKNLVWRTLDGIMVRPYYRSEDLAEIPFIDSKPGEYPYVRGNRTRNNDWDISQDIPVNSFQEANLKALSLLEKGVTSPRFILTEKLPGDVNQLEELLRDIDLQSIPIQFSLPVCNHTLLNLLHELARKKGINPAGIKGSVDLDPFGHLFQTGNFYKDKEKDLHSVKSALNFAITHLPSFRVLAVTPVIFHHAGATISQELGFALATGAEYMAELTDLGLNPGDIASRISFNFSTGSEYFPEIAKLRAARLLWSVMTNAFAPGQKDSCIMRINCSTSGWNQTVPDPYNNLLRAATEAMSAILGGADSLTVLPFDHAAGSYGEFSERLARNTQLILREEAYFNRVADPSAGSFYIENLTNKISENAWKIFIDIEKEGGIVNAFSKGIIQDMIETTAREKLDRIARQKDKIVGINYHPDPGEKTGGKLKTPCQEIPPSKKVFGRPLRKARAACESEEHMINPGPSGEILADN